MVSVRPWVQVLAGAGLALYPWLGPFGVAEVHWRAWFAAVAVHAFSLEVWPLKITALRRLLAGFSLAGVSSVAFLQVLVVYARVTRGYGIDTYILASLIHQSVTNPAAAPPNLWFEPARLSLIQGYFDLVTPLASRLLDLTYDPLRLMAFHSAMILSAPLLTWWIAARNPTLRAFQLLLPLAVLVHPAIAAAMAADYHESEIAVGLLLLGTYWFFADRGKRARAFWPLLLGTLIKISYWPSWFMFGVLSVFRRQWRWTAAYIVVGAAALLAHGAVTRGQAAVGLLPFMGGFGHTPLEVLRNILLHPSLWLPTALQQSRWIFFFALLLPLGFCVSAYPLAIVPVLPLAALTLIDASGTRAIVPAEYATEYLGYLVGGSLVGLAVANRRLRVAVLAVLTIGMGLAFDVPAQLSWLNLSHAPADQRWTGMTISRAHASEAAYSREAQFSECTAGSSPVLATSFDWFIYVREYPERLYVDDGTLGVPKFPEVLWNSFETLVAPHDPSRPGSLSEFPNVTSEHRGSQFSALLDRLRVHVLTPQGWDVWGGQRLSDCAKRFGYTVVSPNVASETSTRLPG